jgi:hypothetical protein
VGDETTEVCSHGSDEAEEAVRLLPGEPGRRLVEQRRPARAPARSGCRPSSARRRTGSRRSRRHDASAPPGPEARRPLLASRTAADPPHQRMAAPAWARSARPRFSLTLRAGKHHAL